jgi:hypothetical protein
LNSKRPEREQREVQTLVNDTFFQRIVFITGMAAITVYFTVTAVVVEGWQSLSAFIRGSLIQIPWGLLTMYLLENEPSVASGILRALLIAALFALTEYTCLLLRGFIQGKSFFSTSFFYLIVLQRQPTHCLQVEQAAHRHWAHSFKLYHPLGELPTSYRKFALRWRAILQ